MWGGACSKREIVGGDDDRGEETYFKASTLPSSSVSRSIGADPR